MGRTKRTKLLKLTNKQHEYFNKLYFSIESKSSFSSFKQFYQAIKADGKPHNITKALALQWYQAQPSITNLQIPRKTKKFRPYRANKIFEKVGLDLLDVNGLSRFNSGVKFLLICKDMLSKYFIIKPLKSKATNVVTQAFEDILKSEPVRRFKVKQCITDQVQYFLAI